MKPKVRKNIQTHCGQYLEKIRNGEVQPLFTSGGDLRHPYFSGFVKLDRTGYRNILAPMIGDPDFAQTLPASIEQEDIRNPFYVLPLDGHKMYVNESVNSIEETMTADPVGTILTAPQIFDPSLSFPTNLMSVLAVLAEKYRSSPEEIDVRQIDRTADLTTADLRAKRIRLLKGKISLARRNLQKGNPEAQTRIDQLKKQIDALRTGGGTSPTEDSQKKEPETDPRYSVLKMGLEMRGRGFQNLFKWMATLPVEDHLDRPYMDVLRKKMKGQIPDLTRTIKAMDADTLTFLDRLTEGYAPVETVEETDDTEILLHTTNYFLIRADLKQDFESLTRYQ
jgi:hypothetical protein